MTSPLPQIVREAAARGPGHPTVDAWQDEFTSSINIMPEHPYPLHARWGVVLMNVPEMVGRKLYEDLSDIYNLAVAGAYYLRDCKHPFPHNEHIGATGARLAAISDLLILQLRFLEFLYNHRRILPHYYCYHVCNCQAWQKRIDAQFEGSRPWRRKRYGNKVRPPVYPRTDPRHGEWEH